MYFAVEALLPPVKISECLLTVGGNSPFVPIESETFLLPIHCKRVNIASRENGIYARLLSDKRFNERYDVSCPVDLHVNGATVQDTREHALLAAVNASAVAFIGTIIPPRSPLDVIPRRRGATSLFNPHRAVYPLSVLR